MTSQEYFHCNMLICIQVWTSQPITNKSAVNIETQITTRYFSS